MNRVYDEARDLPIMASYHEYWQRAADVLASAWPVTGRRKVLLNAAIALALGFDTWRTLIRTHNLTDEQAVELMLRLACNCSPNSG